MRGHVDEQTLAAFREGLLPARKAARISAHLAACQRCAETDAQLAAVTTILARTPAPPMPASLAARLDSALAAEIARSAAASPDGAGVPAAAASPAAAPTNGAASPAGMPSPAGAAAPAGAPAAGERAGRRGRTADGRDTAGRRAGGPGRTPWRLPLRLAAAAAAVVVLAGGGYAVAHVLSAGHAGIPSSASGPAASRSAASGPAASGRLPEAAPGVTAGGLPLVSSGTHYRSGQLPAQVGAVLKRHPAPSQAKAGPALPAAGAFPHLAACVAYLAGGKQPRLVDVAYYGTRPAAVIVVPAPDPAKLNVWVVGPRCPAQGGDVITKFSMPAPG